MTRAAFASLALALLGLGGCRSRGDAPTPKPTADTHEAGATAVVRIDPALVTAGRVVVASLAPRAMRGDVRVPGEVVSNESGAADVGTLVAGRLATIEVREGEVVKRGQVLAWVDAPEAVRVVADVIRARARANASSRKLERQVALEADRATSPAAVDEARAELTVAEADVAAARTMLASLGMAEPPMPSQRVLAARVPIKSPIDGVVVERKVALGEPVAPDKTMFRVVASERVVVEARWTDATAEPPPNGSLASLVPRGGQRLGVCAGHVTSTVAFVDPQTRARRVRVVPDGPCAGLVPGGFVDVAFTAALVGGATTNSLALPKEAVVDVRGAPTIFVATAEPGSFTPRLVRVGRTSEEDVAIDDGVAVGDRVVIVGAVLLKGEMLRAELEAQ